MIDQFSSAAAAAIAAESGISPVGQIEAQALQLSEAEDEMFGSEADSDAPNAKRTREGDPIFPFDAAKAIEAAASFLLLADRRINLMKLVKLIYLLDRVAIARRGIPVVGGAYFSLPHGPVTSQLLDLINSRFVSDAQGIWEQFISRRLNYDLLLLAFPGAAHLSKFEQDLIREVSSSFLDVDQWHTRDWCHDHCGEWTRLEKGRAPISLGKLAEQVGRDPDEVIENANEQDFLAKVFR
jgi:hypothetical protein